MKDSLEILDELSMQYKNAIELYQNKYFDNFDNVKQRAYYRGKVNAFADALDAISSMRSAIIN